MKINELEKFLIGKGFKIDDKTTDCEYIRFKTDNVVVVKYQSTISLYNISNYDESYEMSYGCGMEYLFFICDISKKQLNRLVDLLDKYEIEYRKDLQPFCHQDLEDEMDKIELEIRKQENKNPLKRIR